MKKNKGIYLRDGGASFMVLIVLAFAAVHVVHMVTGGEKRGDTITVSPASEKK